MAETSSNIPHDPMKHEGTRAIITLVREIARGDHSYCWNDLMKIMEAIEEIQHQMASHAAERRHLSGDSVANATTMAPMDGACS